MASTSLTPPLEATGIYKLATPFDDDLITGVLYTCKAIRTIADITASGVDAFTRYYQPKAIDQSKYTADVALDVMIVSLQAANGSMVYVPSTYILSYPQSGGVTYYASGLVVQLSALPESIDLTPVQTQIKNFVKDTLGIDCLISEVVLSTGKSIPWQTAVVTEKARANAITNHTTDTAKLADAQAQLASAQQQIATLQSYISANLKPSS